MHFNRKINTMMEKEIKEGKAVFITINKPVRCANIRRDETEYFKNDEPSIPCGGGCWKSMG